MGGDVPAHAYHIGRSGSNSPYGRGCSGGHSCLTFPRPEFPVWAGMFRRRNGRPDSGQRIPRMGGDVPPHSYAVAAAGLNSPYGRGCSGQPWHQQRPCGEFPVWAGMFRSDVDLVDQMNGIPRMGGDVPRECHGLQVVLWNSPYGRGCSDRAVDLLQSHAEFPVWAGMFRASSSSSPARVRIPRMGGDVPSWATPRCRWAPNSPYGRGCSGSGSPALRLRAEFPVWAGMFRTQSSRPTPST